MNKKGKFDGAGFFGLVGGLLLVIFLSPLALNQGQQIFSAGSGVDGASPTQKVEVITEKACGSTTMAVNFDVKHKSGTDVTAQNATIFLDGEKQIVSEGSTFTAQGKQKITVYPVFDPAGTSYLGGHYEGVLPCTGQTARFSTSDATFMKQASGSALLSSPGEVYESDSAASAETIINDDFTSNPGTAQAIGLGQTKVVLAKLFPVFEEGYGVADGSTLACRFTDSEIDQSGTTVSLNGVNLGDAKYQPSSTRFAVSATNQSTKYWHLPAIDGKLTNEVALSIGIKGDDTNQPTATTNFSCSTFGTDYYEADDGSIKIDVEDRDDNTKIGRTAANEFSFEVLLS